SGEGPARLRPGGCAAGCRGRRGPLQGAVGAGRPAVGPPRLRARPIIRGRVPGKHPVPREHPLGRRQGRPRRASRAARGAAAARPAASGRALGLALGPGCAAR
ncbi:unnamed protein product, partial [Prorocentrum cordatum]